MNKRYQYQGSYDLQDSPWFAFESTKTAEENAAEYIDRVSQTSSINTDDPEWRQRITTNIRTVAALREETDTTVEEFLTVPTDENPYSLSCLLIVAPIRNEITLTLQTLQDIYITEHSICETPAEEYNSITLGQGFKRTHLTYNHVNEQGLIVPNINTIFSFERNQTIQGNPTARYSVNLIFRTDKHYFTEHEDTLMENLINRITYNLIDEGSHPENINPFTELKDLFE